MAKWVLFARKGTGSWPYYSDFFPKKYDSKKLALQCQVDVKELGAVFSEIIAASKCPDLNPIELRDHFVVRCERDDHIFVTKPRAFVTDTHKDIVCPKCGRAYSKQGQIWYADRQLTILHEPE